MTNAEEMAMKTVHDLGVAGDWDVYNYTGLSPVDAGWALDALYRKGYLEIVSTKCECDTNEHGEVIDVEVVRCRECKYHEEEEIEMVYCPNMIGGWVENEWFCANGKRKEGAE